MHYNGVGLILCAPQDCLAHPHRMDASERKKQPTVHAVPQSPKANLAAITIENSRDIVNKG